jgi:hypothetical protein
VGFKFFLDLVELRNPTPNRAGAITEFRFDRKIKANSSLMLPLAATLLQNKSRRWKTPKRYNLLQLHRNDKTAKRQKILVRNLHGARLGKEGGRERYRSKGSLRICIGIHSSGGVENLPFLYLVFLNRFRRHRLRGSVAVGSTVVMALVALGGCIRLGFVGGAGVLGRRRRELLGHGRGGRGARVRVTYQANFDGTPCLRFAVATVYGRITKPPVSTGFAGKGLFFQTVESDKLEKNQIV